MADPRYYVVPCPPQYLGQYSARMNSEVTNKRNFFTGAGKVGDLEILNDLGLDKITEGLRTLSSMSDSVRTGCDSLPTSLGSALGGILDGANTTLEQGAQWVFDVIGLSTNVKDAVEAFNPGVANGAWAQAKVIYENVKNGTFSLTDIPEVLQDLQNLERLGRGIYTNPSSTSSKLQPRCEASPYAIDLVRRAGKFQFLFVVEFVFTGPYTDLSNLVFPFVVKKSTRPSIKFQTEDVNYYNFRSKFVTRTSFDPITMTFMDDQQNQAIRFYNAYLRAMSPVTNLATANEFNMAIDNGMDFFNNITPSNLIGSQAQNRGPISANYYSGSKGTLSGDVRNILHEIRLYHVYDNGSYFNQFTFMNPRIEQLNMTDVDMAASDLSDITFTFNYDSVHIITDQLFDESTTPIFEQARANPVYPLRYNGERRSIQGPNDDGFYAPGTTIGQYTTYNGCNMEINTTISPLSGVFSGSNTSYGQSTGTSVGGLSAALQTGSGILGLAGNISGMIDSLPTNINVAVNNAASYAAGYVNQQVNQYIAPIASTVGNLYNTASGIYSTATRTASSITSTYNSVANKVSSSLSSLSKLRF